jgi:RHS repeat-associated protein
LKSLFQKTAAYYTPYTFSGKERDMETRLSYFGARYYDAGLSIWLSVDPLVEKYPSLSPFNYAINNPVMYIDPDGRSVICETCPEGAQWDVYRNDQQIWNYNPEGNNVWAVIDGEAVIGSYSSSSESQNADFSVDPTYAGWFYEATKNTASNIKRIASNEYVRQRLINNELAGISEKVEPLKTPKSLQLLGRFGGTLFTVWGAIDIEQQYAAREINSFRRKAEHVSNGIGLIPVVGTVWSIGWEGGRAIAGTDWYKEVIKGEVQPKCITCEKVK